MDHEAPKIISKAEATGLEQAILFHIRSLKPYERLEFKRIDGTIVMTKTSTLREEFPQSVL